MLDYLPTWVELPIPSLAVTSWDTSTSLDPNIWNPQPSQMNRIKIRDTSQAGTQLWRQSQDPGPALQSSASAGQRPQARTASPRGTPQPQPLCPSPGRSQWQTCSPRKVVVLAGPWSLQRRNHPTTGWTTWLPRTAGPGHAVLQRQLPVTPDDPGMAGGRWSPTGWMGRRRKTDDDYVTLSDQDSLSGSSDHGPGPRRASLASSSVSDEYFEVTDRSA